MTSFILLSVRKLLGKHWGTSVPVLCHPLFSADSGTVCYDVVIPDVTTTQRLNLFQSWLAIATMDKMDHQCCKLRRISSQDGPVGYSKFLLARQCVTSDVPAMTLDVCSDDARSTRAILLKLSWTNVVRRGNKFPRREVKQTARLLDATDADAGEHGLQIGKPERSQEWTFSQRYTCRQKSRRNVPANRPPNSNPLLQIQVPN